MRETAAARLLDPEFAVDVLEVLGNGPRADLQRTGDGGIGAAVSDESQDLDLALGEAGKPGAGPWRAPARPAGVCEPGAGRRSTGAGAR